MNDCDVADCFLMCEGATKAVKSCFLKDACNFFRIADVECIDDVV